MSIRNFKLFDAHLHIIDDRFPLVRNHGYLPEPFTCEDYCNRMMPYTLCGGAIVAGSFQGFEQSYLIEALKILGPSFVGVTQLPVTVSDQDLIDLSRSGVRGLRFNLKRGGSERLRHLDWMARHVHAVAGWHVELYIDSRELSDLYQCLVALPAVSVDHLGLSKAGFKTLIKLVERGVRVKASGFGRVDFNVRDALLDLYAANPKSLMFGTDLPSTRAARPYTDNDFILIIEALGAERATRVLYENAIEFYSG